MKVEIIAIGDELLIGQTINTNASWIGQVLTLRGAFVQRVLTIKDQIDDIRNAFSNCLSAADVVIVTGGLGPTKDDVTKKVIADYFNDELVIHQETLEIVQGFFARSNRPMLDVNIQQAAVPSKCKVLINRQGTAPGMWMEQNGKILISLPGVPYEMKGLMEQEVLPKLDQIFSLSQYYSKTGNIQGIGESYLADTMSDWENRLRNEGLDLAYLPSPGLIRLRISSKIGEVDKAKIERYFEELEAAYPQNFFGYGDVSISEVVGQLLIANNKTIATCESCTGGALASAIVSVPGSSVYYQGSLVTYSNELKMKLAGVSAQTLTDFGAVSEETVLEMAQNTREKLQVDYAIAISGIAGPTGGTDEKPVGTVWMAVASDSGVVAKKFLLVDNRERFIQRAVLSALNFIRISI